MPTTKIPIKQITQLRQLLHKHPELSGEEQKTAKRICGFLKSYGPNTITQNVGGTGVMVTYNFGKAGPTIVIRCELDALPIQEINDFKHKSTVDGVSHKCGHDGHMSIVAGLGTVLSKPQKNLNGKVVLLFQPAEENGLGAEAIMKDEVFKNLKPDYIFALHNLPGVKKGHVLCKPGGFTAAAKSIIIKLNGKTSHAAEPEHGINPALAVAEIIKLANELENTNTGSNDFALITPIHINLGSLAYGISAGYAELHFTLRAWSNKVLNSTYKKFETEAIKIAKTYNIDPKTDWTQAFSSTENDPAMFEAVKQAALKNELAFEEKETPFKWGEDFGLYTQAFKGAMFGIGAGTKTPALHNPDYDYPDDITADGVTMFYDIIKRLLG